MLISNDKILINDTKVLTHLDIDAQLFLNAQSNTDTNQILAINELILDLKYYNLWSKMKAVYPFIGGTADKHKYNLKDPRDLDAAYRLTFNGGLTHSSNGILPNGTTGYANTYLNPSTHLTNYNTHLSYYARTNIIVGSGLCFGVGVSLNKFIIGYDNSSALSYQYKLKGTDPSDGIISNTSILNGLVIGTRTSNSSNGHKLYLNGSEIGSGNTTNGLLPNNNTYLFAINDEGVPFYFHDKECAFATIGEGLTNINALNLYNIIQKYQNRLRRAV